LENKDGVNLHRITFYSVELVNVAKLGRNMLSNLCWTRLNHGLKLTCSGNAMVIRTLLV